MASAPSRKDSERFTVLNCHVDVSRFTDEPRGGRWSRIECVSKKAYGCGDLGQDLVESLRLYVRLGAYPVVSSSLAIRTSDEMVRRIGAKLGAPKDNPDGWLMASGTIHIAGDKRLMVIVLLFHHNYSPKLPYYLVYDGFDSSLSLINYLPDGYGPCCTLTPALDRIGDCGGDFQLVLLGRKLLSDSNDGGVLCMCTPDSRANQSADDGMGPWKVKACCLPTNAFKPIDWLAVDVVFTFQDKVFWADFTEGCLLYCDPHASGDCAEFIFIGLPPQCLPDPEDDESRKIIRNMGYVGDSIWLAYIHLTESDDLLMMWSLDLANKQWKQEVEISVKSLWELDGFKKAGLPKTSLYFPVFIPEGALCLALLDERSEDCVCCIDVRGEKLLWHGYVPNYLIFSQAILPPNFFWTLPSTEPGQIQGDFARWINSKDTISASVRGKSLNNSRSMSVPNMICSSQ